MRLPLPRIPLPYWLWRTLVLSGGRPPVRVTRSSFTLRGLPGAMSGLRTVFLTDLHLGPHVPEVYLRAVIRQAVALEPDLFLLGGDYIDRSHEELLRVAPLLRLLSVTGRPVVGVLGNHDWWSERGVAAEARGERLRRVIADTGVTLLENSRVFVSPDRSLGGRIGEAGGLCIAGLGDWGEASVDPGGALGGVAGSVPRVVLSHNPDAVLHPQIAEGAHRIDLMLCGHTHGGQCAFPVVGTPILLVKSRQHGRGLSQGPGFPILTSHGVGVSSLPVRLGCPPEIHELTFVSAV